MKTCEMCGDEITGIVDNLDGLDVHPECRLFALIDDVEREIKRCYNWNTVEKVEDAIHLEGYLSELKAEYELVRVV